MTSSLYGAAADGVSESGTKWGRPRGERRGIVPGRAALLLSVLGAFAEFERALIRERQLEGIALAKAAAPTRAGNHR